MAKTLHDVIKELSSEQRHEVEAQAAHLIEDEILSNFLRKAADVTHGESVLEVHKRVALS